MIRFIDKRVHPTYLRLVEGVLTPLAQPIAYFSRRDRGKGTEDLDSMQVMQELKRGPAACISQAYQHIMRNSIAHGGITFLQNEIRYRDRTKEDTFSITSVIRLFDDLVDICNGLAASLKLFFLISRDLGYIPPLELLIEELQETTKTPWWTIEGCIESEVIGKSQLIIYA